MSFIRFVSTPAPKELAYYLSEESLLKFFQILSKYEFETNPRPDPTINDASLVESAEKLRGRNRLKSVKLLLDHLINKMPENVGKINKLSFINAIHNFIYPEYVDSYTKEVLCGDIMHFISDELNLHKQYVYKACTIVPAPFVKPVITSRVETDMEFFARVNLIVRDLTPNYELQTPQSAAANKKATS